MAKVVYQSGGRFLEFAWYELRWWKWFQFPKEIINVYKDFANASISPLSKLRFSIPVATLRCKWAMRFAPWPTTDTEVRKIQQEKEQKS